MHSGISERPSVFSFQHICIKIRQLLRPTTETRVSPLGSVTAQFRRTSLAVALGTVLLRPAVAGCIVDMPVGVVALGSFRIVAFQHEACWPVGEEFGNDRRLRGSCQVRHHRHHSGCLG